MNVKDRRVDLRWKMADKTPVEIAEVCKTITQEREKLMKEKTLFLSNQLAEFLPDGYKKYETLFPDVYARFVKARDIYNAQALRWVWDEASPIEWDDSDVYRAAAELGSIAMEFQALEIYR